MASKIKGRPPKQPKVTPALPSDDSQQLHENNPGNNLALETCGESSSSHGTGGPKPGPSKKTLNERKRKYGDILDEQQKLFQQFQSIHMQKIEEFKELCDRHLKNLQAIKCCRRKAIIEEARKLMDYLEKRVTEETVHVNKQEAKDGVQSSLLSLLIS